MCFLQVRGRLGKDGLCSTKISAKLLLDLHKINTKQEEETLKMLLLSCRLHEGAHVLINNSAGKSCHVKLLCGLFPLNKFHQKNDKIVISIGAC